MGAPQNHRFLNTKMVQFWTMWGTPILGPPGIYIYIMYIYNDISQSEYIYIYRYQTDMHGWLQILMPKVARIPCSGKPPWNLRLGVIVRHKDGHNWVVAGPFSDYISHKISWISPSNDGFYTPISHIAACPWCRIEGRPIKPLYIYEFGPQRELPMSLFKKWVPAHGMISTKNDQTLGVMRTHTYLHSYIPTFLHSYIPTFLHIYIPTYLHSYIPTFLHSYIPTSLHPYIPTSLHPYIPTSLHPYIPTYPPTHLPTCLQADRDRQRQIETDRDRQRQTETDGRTDGQTERQTDRDRHRERETETERDRTETDREGPTERDR